ncbi:MAG: hypothetical protein ABW119_22010, partial [Candidatus Thiodiazotropha lotti]
LEHYLLSVLPFGGTHPNAEKNLSVDAARRLNKNKKLKNHLKEEIGFGHVPQKNNELERRLHVPFDGEKLHKFSEFVGRGLLWHHWQCRVPSQYAVEAFTPSPTGLKYVDSLFTLNTKHRVCVNLGNGTVRYKGAMSESDECLSVWAIQFLGGVTVSEKSYGIVFKNSFAAVLVAPKRHLEELG